MGSAIRNIGRRQAAKLNLRLMSRQELAWHMTARRSAIFAFKCQVELVSFDAHRAPGHAGVFCRLIELLRDSCACLGRIHSAGRAVFLLVRRILSGMDVLRVDRNHRRDSYPRGDGQLWPGESLAVPTLRL